MSSPSVLSLASRTISPSTSKSSDQISEKHNEHLPWILHHILECKLSTELPLRIMFSYNAGHKLPSVKDAHKWWNYDRQGKLIIDFLSSLEKVTPTLDELPLANPGERRWGALECGLNGDHDPPDRFMDAGNDLLLAALDMTDTNPELRARPKSQGVPLGVVESICHMVYTPNYRESQANFRLTAIDYIQDLEWTRRRKLQEAAINLGITKDNWRNVLGNDKLALEWVELVQSQELTIEGLYAKAFVDMRIWTMARELHEEPFYKPVMLAMLNTLFPPSKQDLPNDSINPKSLARYRTTFFRYLLAVEKDGPKVLDPFVNQLLIPGKPHSWVQTRENLDNYLDLAGSMIEQAEAVQGIDFFRGRDDDELVHSTIKKPLEYGEDVNLAKGAERVTFDLERGYFANPFEECEIQSTSSRLPKHDRNSSNYSNVEWSAQSSGSYSNNGSQISPKTPATPFEPCDDSIFNTHTRPKVGNTADFNSNLDPTDYFASPQDISYTEPLGRALKKSSSIQKLTSRFKSFASTSNLRDGYRERKQISTSTVSYDTMHSNVAERVASERVKLAQLMAQLPPEGLNDEVPEYLKTRIKAAEERIAFLNDMVHPHTSPTSEEFSSHVSLARMETMGTINDTQDKFVLDAPPSPKKAKKLRKAQSARSLISTQSLISIPESDTSVVTVIHQPTTPSHKRSWPKLRRSKSNLLDRVITGDDIHEPMPPLPLSMRAHLNPPLHPPPSPPTNSYKPSSFPKEAMLGHKEPAEFTRTWLLEKARAERAEKIPVRPDRPEGDGL